MMAVRVLAGFTSSICALARAEASWAMESLDEGMAVPVRNELKADRPRLRALGSEAMAKGFPRILRHECLELTPGTLVLRVCGPGPREGCGMLGPSIRRAHVDDPNDWHLGLRRLSAEPVREVAGLHAAPENALDLEEDRLVDRVGL